MINRVLGIFLLVVCFVGCTSVNTLTIEDDAKQSWGRMCYSTFQKNVREISGVGVTNCGFFANDSVDSKKQFVQNCAKNIVKSNKSFIFGHQSWGDDSMFCDVAIKDENGKFWSFFYDSDVSGGNGGPASLWVGECEKIIMEPGTIGQDSFFRMDSCKERKDIKSKVLSK